ncbi:hypothetical protein [Halorubrum kocurii]|uniref:NET2A-D/KIP1-like alpha-helical domain-containing protein n=1 Tax=Halorubrum kocurii JCM 14978 TaxID=1230456 RepID=M0NPB0_9EURY|nr:hypothetical protein [Halorubrum kocurii]EMA59463.1 hypothetical protein C468_14527 [Halorubrum kocurii JCM 14978]
MSERTAEATTTVDEDGIRVEKSFTDDAFPVPAVMYELSSTREDPVRVRIVDRIPESFPMDRIGFHPEYESDNWTAYKDHRVEFERVVEPDEAIETVFGIRDDDPDLDGFLGTPVIEHVPVGEEIEDVLGAGDTDAVREVLSGDRATLPGMEEPHEAEGEASDPPTDPLADPDEEAPAAAETDDAPDEMEAPEPRDVDAGTAAVTSHTGEPDADEPDADEPDADEPLTDDADEETVEVTAEGVDDAAAAESAPVDAEEPEPEAADVEPEVTDAADAGDSGETGEPPAAAPDDGLAAALASEIRAGDVDDDDLETLRSELDVGVPRSVDVRIARLQSSVADIEAYADALAEFIDGEGTAREILDDLDEKVDAVESEMAAIDDRLASADADRNDLREDLSRVDDSVSAATAEIDDVTERVDGVDDRVADVESEVSGVEESVTAVEGTVADLGDTVAGVEETVDGVTDDVSRLDDETTGLDEAVDDLNDDVETLYEEVDDAAAGLEATEDRVDDVEARMGRFDEEFDDLWDDLAEVDTRLTDIEERLGEDLDDVEAELDAINDHLEELEAFRKRLNEAFGP